MAKKSFVFYKEWRDAISDLPNDVRLEIYDGIIDYATTGDIPALKPMAKIAFNFIKTSIDRDAERYMSITERNRVNGVKGGRPKKETQQEPTKPTGFSVNPQEPKKADNDNDNDNEYDNDLKEKETSPNGESKKGELSLPQSERIDFVGLMEYFNSTFHGKLQTIKSIDDKRKKAIKARIAQYDKQAIDTVFRLILDSPFLLGQNDRNWKCDFDWIFKPTNFTKILEGNYNEKRIDTTTARRASVNRLKDLAGSILQGAEP